MSKLVITWRKSSRSAAAQNCVEVATLPGDQIAIRDSKNPNTGVLIFDHTDITTWIRSLMNQ